MNGRALISLVLMATLLSFAAIGVEAQRRGRRGRRAQAPAAPPQSEAIAPALGELRWGMEPRAVNEHFRSQIEERYRERLQKSRDSIQEDRIRAEMNNEIRQLRESYVRFRGDRTGWDASFLRGEFTHNNRESMLVYRDGNSQNFFFFIGGRLWKWYKAFDTSVFEGRSFDEFSQAVQGRFGEAVRRRGRLAPGGPMQQWLEWQDASTRLRAIDQTSFYGFYCLVFEDKATLARLDELRTNEENTSSRNRVVESVLLNEHDDSDHDQHDDIADRITGTRRSSGPEGREAQTDSTNGSSSNAAPTKQRSSSRGRSSSSDDALDLSDL